MIIELSKRLGEVSDDLSLVVKSNDNIFTMGIYAQDIGIIYFFSSTDKAETYSKINYFIDCLNDEDKMEELIKEISNVELEV